MLSGGVLDTECLDEDVQELFRYKGDGTVEVHRWVNDVQWYCIWKFYKSAQRQ